MADEMDRDVENALGNLLDSLPIDTSNLATVPLPIESEGNLIIDMEAANECAIDEAPPTNLAPSTSEVSPTLDKDSDDDQQWDVEAVVAIRRIKGKPIRFNKYLVKWLGFAKKTWEPLKNLQDGAGKMVHEFHVQNPRHGRSPIPPHLRLERFGRAKTVPHNRDMWLTAEEIQNYIKDRFEGSCHIFDINKTKDFVDGINATILGIYDHAFTVIVLKNFLGFEKKVLIGDALNYFNTAERATQQHRLASKIMSMFDVKQMEVISHQPQIHADTCAYAAIIALEETIRQLRSIPLVPVIITYPPQRVKDLIRKFNRDPKDTAGLAQGRFEAGPNLVRLGRCSYCSFEKRVKNSYQSKVAHEKCHRAGEFIPTYEERQHLILLK